VTNEHVPVTGIKPNHAWPTPMARRFTSSVASSLILLLEAGGAARERDCSPYGCVTPSVAICQYEVNKRCTVTIDRE
jgi:hypothetical protein